MFKKIKNKKGFTLIELMVVIAIIGLLSSIVLASLKGARDKAANQKFKSETMELIKALELYKANNGQYPYENAASANGTTNYSAAILNNKTETVTTGDSLLSTLLIPKYIKQLPTIPNTSLFPTNYALTYATNFDRSKTVISCVNDNVLDRTDGRVPKYVIYIANTNPAFDQFTELSSTRAWWSAGSFISLPDACFSLK